MFQGLIHYKIFMKEDDFPKDLFFSLLEFFFQDEIRSLENFVNFENFLNQKDQKDL